MVWKTEGFEIAHVAVGRQVGTLDGEPIKEIKIAIILEGAAKFKFKKPLRVADTRKVASGNLVPY